jgi:uncharacterized OsmC-like protein
MPNPSETLLAALGACLSAGIQANAVAQAIPIRHLAIDLEADTSLAAHWGTGESDPGSIGFEAVAIQVHIDADAPREVLKALLDHALLWSPVANTLHNPIHLDLVLVRSTSRTFDMERAVPAGHESPRLRAGASSDSIGDVLTQDVVRPERYPAHLARSVPQGEMPRSSILISGWTRGHAASRRNA